MFSTCIPSFSFNQRRLTVHYLKPNLFICRWCHYSMFSFLPHCLLYKHQIDHDPFCCQWISKLRSGTDLFSSSSWLSYESSIFGCTNSVYLLGLSTSFFSLCWPSFISELDSCAARTVFRFAHLPYRAQIRPTLEYCSHMWDGVLSTPFSLFDPD